MNENSKLLNSDEAQRPPAGGWRSIVLSSGITLVIIVGLGFLKFWQIKTAIAEHGNFKLPPEGVKTITTALQKWQPKYQVSGTIKAVKGVLLRTEDAGILKNITFKEGDSVKKGDLLFELDTAVEAAQLLSAKAGLELARRELERSNALWNERATSKSAVQTATAQSAQAESEVLRLEALINRKTIRAPFEGTVGIRRVDPGEYLSIGTALVELQDLSQLYVDFSVPQRILPFVTQGSTVEVETEQSGEGGKSDQLTATVTGVDPTTNKKTLTVNLRASINKEQARKFLLLSGMYVKVKASSGVQKDTIVLPSSAISYAPYGNSVFVLNVKDGKSTVAGRMVRVGQSIGDSVPVVEGLNVGDVVVMAGTFKLMEGSEVVVDTSPAPTAPAELPNS
jgi:membrane fusion protein, multidrug efflux system